MQSVQDGLRLKSIPPCRAYHIAGMLKIVLADKNGAWTWSLRGLIWEFICAFRENNNHSKPAPACTTTFPCCCTGGQGGVSWAPSSPWVVETEKKKKKKRSTVQRSSRWIGAGPAATTALQLVVFHRSLSHHKCCHFSTNQADRRSSFF